jgi:hypothetical protein
MLDTIFLKMLGVGAKIPRNCLFLHVPLESSDIQHSLLAKGFNGNQPSVWVIQVIEASIFFMRIPMLHKTI